MRGLKSIRSPVKKSTTITDKLNKSKTSTTETKKRQTILLTHKISLPEEPPMSSI